MFFPHMMLADMEDNKKLIPLVAQLFLRERKLNISLVFVSKFYFKVLKKEDLVNHFYFSHIIEVLKREPQEIALNHSSDNEFKNFMKLFKGCSREQFSLLVNHTTLPSDNSLRFRKNLL